MEPRVFLLSPANCRGQRARQVLSERSQSEVAARLRSEKGVPVGELFAYLSGLYFRGKLTYARRFAVTTIAPKIDGRASRRRPGRKRPSRLITTTPIPFGAFVITPDRGLVPAEMPIDLETLRAFGAGEIRLDNAAYRQPLEATATALAAAAPQADVVLLGSIASGKYVEVLGKIFGPRLKFPADFVGRGDMSRGGLLLRAAAQGRELDYIPVIGAVLHGQRPPKLEPLKRSATPLSAS